MYKFRTIVPDAEKLQAHLESCQETKGPGPCVNIFIPDTTPLRRSNHPVPTRLSSKWLAYCWGAVIICCAVLTVNFLSNLPKTIDRPETLLQLVLWPVLLALLLLPFTVRLLESTGSAIFYALVLACPLDIGKSWWYIPLDYSGPRHEFRLTIALILLFLLTILIAFKAASRIGAIRSFKDTTLPALLFLLLSGISCIVASNVALALFELCRMVSNILIYFVVANYVASERPSPHRLTIVIAVAILIHGAVAVIEQQTGATLGMSWLGEGDLRAEWGDQLLPRAGGLMGYPNGLAVLMLLYGSVTLLAALFSSAGKLRSLLPLSAAMSIMVLLITYTRSAWTALGLGAAVTVPTAIRLLRNSSARQKRRIQRLAVAFLFCAAVAGVACRSSLAERLTQSDAGSAESRVDMMIDALAMIKDNWLIGVGLNNYSVAIWKYDVTGIHRAWGATAVVHNLFLLIAAETGIASLAIFCFLLYRVLRKGRQRLAAHAITPEAVLIAGLRLGIICFLIQSGADAAYRFSPGLQRTLWLFMGLMTGYAEWPNLRQGSSTAVTAQPQPSRSVYAVVPGQSWSGPDVQLRP